MKQYAYKLALKLCFTPTEDTRIEWCRKTRKWWLLGCIEGDQSFSKKFLQDMINEL